MSDAVAKHNKTIQDATTLRAKIASQIACAIDQCIKSCDSQAEKDIAYKLQQRVIVALTTSPSSAGVRTRGSIQSAPTSHANHSTWAQVASHPHTPMAGKQSKHVNVQAATALRSKAHTLHVPPREDLRIFIIVPTTTRLQKPSPFAVR